jgi:hypothetical protein
LESSNSTQGGQMSDRILLYLLTIAITVTSLANVSVALESQQNAYLYLVSNYSTEKESAFKQISSHELVSISKRIFEFEKISSDSLLTYSEYVKYSDLYAALGENGSAFQLLKTAQLMKPEETSLTNKMLRIAAASSDSTFFIEQVLNLIGKRSLIGFEDCIDFAFKELNNRDDSTHIQLLINKTENHLESLSQIVRFWHVLNDYSAGRYELSCDNLEALIISGSNDLDNEKRGIAIQLLPDLLFLKSDYQSAGIYYEILNENCLNSNLVDYANLMIQRIELLEGHYSESITDNIRSFENNLSNQLFTMKQKGVSYGIDNLYAN